MLKKERAAVLGNPVRGITTPFVRSFDTALPPEPSPESAQTKIRVARSPAKDAPGSTTGEADHLNFYLTKDELSSNISRSKWLTQEPDQEQGEPSAVDGLSLKTSDDIFSSENAKSIDDLIGSSLQNDAQARNQRKPDEEHETAEEVLRRISSLSLGSSSDRLRANIQRCVDIFGRHNTDATLPPKPQSMASGDQPQAFPRIGPDTGSSEVQIAILTAKIRALADQLELRGRPDKVNKRNLRLLVHRRAKLLKYMRRKERGGPRWKNLVDTLGLTEGTWKGEISL